MVHICVSAFLSTALMVFSETQNFINAYKRDYFQTKRYFENIYSLIIRAKKR